MLCSLSALHLYPALRGTLKQGLHEHSGDPPSQNGRTACIVFQNEICVSQVEHCARYKRFFSGSLFVRYNSAMSVTRRQREVLDFISNFVQRNEYSPSFEEIARGLSLKSLATVHKHITKLQKKGLLQL